MTDGGASRSEETILELLQLTNLVIRRLGPLFRKARITPQQWTVLSLLATAEEPPTLAGISRAMKVSKQNTTGMIARLEAMGLISRAGDESDLRASRVQLTRKGQGLYQRISPAYQEWLDGALGKLSAADRKTLHRALGVLLESMT